MMKHIQTIEDAMVEQGGGMGHARLSLWLRMAFKIVLMLFLLLAISAVLKGVS